MGHTEVTKHWANLLKQRSLLYSNRSQFKSEGDYAEQWSSSSTEDQNRVMAMVTQANTAWGLVMELLRELLMAQDDVNAGALRRLDNKELEREAHQAMLITRSQMVALSDMRGGRNEEQHRNSFVLPQTAWAQISLVTEHIDKLMLQIQEGFAHVGTRLEMDFPPFHAAAEIEL
jgi:hypothetical protein